METKRMRYSSSVKLFGVLASIFYSLHIPSVNADDSVTSLDLVAVDGTEPLDVPKKITATDDSAHTDINWFNLEVYQTAEDMSDESIDRIKNETAAILDFAFVDIYYNFRKFNFTILQAETITREDKSSLRRRNLRKHRADGSSRDLQNGMETGVAITFSGSSLFFVQPVQSQNKVDIAILETVNSNPVNDQLIEAFKATGDAALADVYFVEAVPFPSEAPSLMPSDHPSQSPTLLSSVPPTLIPSVIPSKVPTQKPSIFPSQSPSILPSHSPSTSPSLNPSNVPSQQPSIVPSLTPSSLPSFLPSTFPSLTPSLVPSQIPSTIPSLTPSLLPTHKPSNVPSIVPSLTPSLMPSHSPSNVPSLTPSLLPTQLPTIFPSLTPSTFPSYSPSNFPSLTPSLLPTQHPSVVPSLTPSTFPSYSPSNFPSFTPSQVPSQFPSISPSQFPSISPSHSPSYSPSFNPSNMPSQYPSISPSQFPSILPSQHPSIFPSLTPSLVPSQIPSIVPSQFPSVLPSQYPSIFPSLTPSLVPSQIPSTLPSQLPSVLPSLHPSIFPSNAPSISAFPTNSGIISIIAPPKNDRGPSRIIYTFTGLGLAFCLIFGLFLRKRRRDEDEFDEGVGGAQLVEVDSDIGRDLLFSSTPRDGGAVGARALFDPNDDTPLRNNRQDPPDNTLNLDVNQAALNSGLFTPKEAISPDGASIDPKSTHGLSTISAEEEKDNISGGWNKFIGAINFFPQENEEEEEEQKHQQIQTDDEEAWTNANPSFDLNAEIDADSGSLDTTSTLTNTLATAEDEKVGGNVTGPGSIWSKFGLINPSESQSVVSESSQDTGTSRDSKKLMNDLKWLENRIAEVKGTTASVVGSPSVSANENSSSAGLAAIGAAAFISTPSSPSSASSAMSPIMQNIICRDCYAPPGKLNIFIQSTRDGPIVHSISKNSALKDQIFSGDLIIAVDNVDTRAMSADEVLEIMKAKNGLERKITVLHFDA